MRAFQTALGGWSALGFAALTACLVGCSEEAGPSGTETKSATAVDRLTRDAPEWRGHQRRRVWCRGGPCSNVYGYDGYAPVGSPGGTG